MPFNLALTSNLVIKLLFLIANAFYIIFSLVVYNQVVSLTNIISQVRSSTTLKLIALLNIIFAVVLFLAAFVIL